MSRYFNDSPANKNKQKGSWNYVSYRDRKKRTEEKDYMDTMASEITNLESRIKAVGGETEKKEFRLLPAALEGLRRTDYAATNVLREFIPGKQGATEDSKFDPIAAGIRGLKGQDKTEAKEVVASLGLSEKPLFKAKLGKVNISPSPAGIAGFMIEAFNPLNPINWLTFGAGSAVKAGVKGAAKETGKKTIEKGLQHGISIKAVNPLTGKKALEGNIPGTKQLTTALAPIGKAIKESDPYQKLSKSFSTKHIPEDLPNIILSRQLRGDYVGESLENFVRSGSKQASENVAKQTVEDLFANPDAFLGLKVSPKDKGYIGEISKINPETNKISVKFADKQKGSRWTNEYDVGDLRILDSPVPKEKLADEFTQTVGVEAFTDVRRAREAVEQMSRGEIDKVDKEIRSLFKGLSKHERQLITRAVGLRDKNILPEKLSTYYEAAVNSLEGWKKWLKGAGLLERDMEKYVPFIATGRKLSSDQKAKLQKQFGTGIKTFEGLNDVQEWYAKFFPNLRERTTKAIVPQDVNEVLSKKFFEDDIAEILSIYSSRAIKAKSAKDFFDATIGKYGIRLDDAKKIKEIPQGYGLFRVTINPETGERTFEDVSRATWRQVEQQIRKQQKLIDNANEKAERIARKEQTTGVSTTETITNQINRTRLPRDLRGAKPKYGYGKNLFDLNFESDVDKALYIVAKPTPSKADQRYMDFLKGLYPDKSDNQIREFGMKVRDQIKKMASQADGKSIEIKSQESIRGVIKDKIETSSFTKQDVPLINTVKTTTTTTPGEVPPLKLEIPEDIIALPAEFANHINEYMGAFFDKTMQGTLWDYFDKANGVFKTMAYLWNPGHIPRDATSNMFQLWLMGMRTKDLPRYADGIKILKGDKFTPKGVKTSSEKILQQARDYGLIGTEMVSADIGINILTKNKYTEYMRKATRAVDDSCRIAGFVDRLAKGYSPEQAAFEVKKYLFDYFELTPFERKWMKRFIPFYTWTRKNIPLQFQEFFRQPGKYAGVARTHAAISEDYGSNDAPDWIKESAGLLLPGEEGKRLYAMSNLPYADIGNTPRDLLSGVNPLIRTPFELATGKKVFSDTPINNKLEYALGQIAPILPRLQTILDKDNPKQNARIMSTLGLPPTYNEEAVNRSAKFERRDELRKIVEELKDKGIEVPTTQELNKKKTRSRYWD